MSALGKKLRQLEGGLIAFWCPGCKETHTVRVRSSDNTPRPSWTFDGNLEAPTFTPSVLVRGIREDMTEEEQRRYDALCDSGATSDALLASEFGTLCHTFVTAGRIQFLGDCRHSLKGQTVDLPDFPEGVEA